MYVSASRRPRNIFHARGRPGWFGLWDECAGRLTRRCLRGAGADVVGCGLGVRDGRGGGAKGGGESSASFQTHLYTATRWRIMSMRRRTPSYSTYLSAVLLRAFGGGGEERAGDGHQGITAPGTLKRRVPPIASAAFARPPAVRSPRQANVGSIAHRFPARALAPPSAFALQSCAPRPMRPLWRALTCRSGTATGGCCRRRPRRHCLLQARCAHTSRS